MSGSDKNLENPLHSAEEITRIRSAALQDADKYGQKSRFGYFSIPFPITIGDRYYAFKQKPHERDDRGKVKIEPRNIQTTIPKIGKSPDVYFENILKEDQKHLDERKLYFNKKNEEKLEQIKFLKDKKEFKDNFKPSGPQELKDYFTINKFVNNNPLYKIPERRAHYDKSSKKMIIENKNILTNPLKKGCSSTPGILFSYPKNVYDGKPKRPHTTFKRKEGKKSDKFEFKPANTHLNSFFQSNKDQYALPEKLRDKLKGDFERAKTAGGHKFEKSHSETWSKHDRDFVPASGKKLGEKGYFSQRYGVPFTPFIALKRKEKSSKKYSEPFK